MAKPKLALVPAAQGSKFYSVLPSSGVGDFDFTRSGSATRINSQGLIETVTSGVSRLNYPLIDGVVKGCPSHILEPQRSNLNTFSDPTDAQKGSTSYASVTYQDDFYWGLGNVINNAIVFGDNSTTRYAYYSSTVASGTEYTLSVFIKMDDNSIPIPATDFLIVLAGTSIATGYNVESYGNNIYRVSVSGSASASNTANGILKVASHSTKGFKISAFQVEQGSYVTSYIPTSGSAVTRSAETAIGSGDASTFNDSEGVLMAEISALVESSPARVISIGEGLNYENGIIMSFDTSDNLIKYRVRSNNITTVDLSASNVDRTLNHKICLKYKVNDFELWIDGFKINYALSGAVPLSLSKLQFSDMNVTGAPFYGNTKQLQYFDSALNDSDLETLTSWVSFTDMAESQLYTIE